MVAWLSGHASLLGWVGVLSVVMGVGTLVLAPLVVARLPVDYFTQARHPALGGPRRARGPRLLGRLGKNLLGVLVVLAGVAMLLLPGQGLLTIAIGLMLLDVPGKGRLERRLVQRPVVWRALNWIRAKAHRPPLERPAPALGGPGEPGAAS
jgi:putative transmembrane protein PGPGW